VKVHSYSAQKLGYQHQIDAETVLRNRLTGSSLTSENNKGD
jgi:hypothetical protein